MIAHVIDSIAMVIANTQTVQLPRTAEIIDVVYFNENPNVPILVYQYELGYDIYKESRVIHMSLIKGQIETHDRFRLIPLGHIKVRASYLMFVFESVEIPA